MKRDEIKAQLLQPQSNYTAAKTHAQQLDQMLGYQCDPIETSLNREALQLKKAEQQFWIGLDLQSLQTPYSEIVEMIQYLKPQDGNLWIDLGAAYGRMGLVLGFLQPLVRFIGYEFISERVAEGNRVFKTWSLQNALLKQADLTSSQVSLEKANVYFIYDFGSKKDVYEVLEKLRKIASEKPICVVARGRGIKNWVLHDFPWLAEMQEPEYFGNWTLFRS